MLKEEYIQIVQGDKKRKQVERLVKMVEKD